MPQAPVKKQIFSLKHMGRIISGDSSNGCRSLRRGAALIPKNPREVKGHRRSDSGGRILRLEPILPGGNRRKREQSAEKWEGHEPSLLATAALWLLMLLGATLPLFLGGVSEMGDLWFNALGWSAVALWLGGLLQQGRFPVVSPWVVVPLGLALVVGTAASLNAECTYDGPFGGFRAIAFNRWLPSTVDASISLAAMRHWTLLGALFWMSCHFCALRTQSDWYRNSLTLGGVVQILLALGQRLADARSVLGSGVGERLPFFGTFLYPGSAGAYLNLLIPLFCLHVLCRTERSLVGIAGLAGLGVAIFWNTSRLSSVVGIFTASLLALALGWVAWRHAGKGQLGAVVARRMSRLRPALVTALFVGGLALFVFPVPPLFEKWKLLPEQWSRSYPRFEAMRACVEICRDAGAWGFGPGTFGSVFPHYAQEMAECARGVWRHAHCDYLEWMIEWGWGGCLLWSFLPLGALACVAVRFWSEKTVRRRAEAACNGAALLALALHGLADFPLFNPAVQLLAVFWLGNAWSQRPPSSGASVMKISSQRPLVRGNRACARGAQSDLLPAGNGL